MRKKHKGDQRALAQIDIYDIDSPYKKADIAYREGLEKGNAELAQQLRTEIDRRFPPELYN